jgi:thioredoxin reductase (NADPH)
MGELAQLAGRPALADAIAKKPVQALIIAPERLRALLTAEAELGERIMRALILRRVGLLEIGAGGPIIIGRAENGDVLRLQGFLRQNGHPHQFLDPNADDEAKALIEQFHVDPSQLPIVLCPSGQMLRNPSEQQLARCLGLVGPIASLTAKGAAIEHQHREPFRCGIDGGGKTGRPGSHDGNIVDTPRIRAIKAMPVIPVGKPR